MPTRIVFGERFLDVLNTFINNRRVALITSRGFVSRGVVNDILAVCPGIVTVVSDIKSHPEFKDLRVSYNELHKSSFDLIVAVGGGSVLDAAKFLSVHNDDKDYTFVEAIGKGKLKTSSYKTIPIISVPTTSGTGSELTPWASLWDLDEKKKYSIHLKELFSEVSIYDPELTLTVPKKITLQTGLDTLSHSLESIWNKNASPITVLHAIKAAKLLLKYLPLLINNLENINYRTCVMESCMHSAMAFSNTQTSIAHGMSYYITANKGIEHGIACSFTLPLLIDHVIGQYSFIDNALIEIFGELSSRKLRGIYESLNISTKFSDYGVSQEDLDRIKSSLINNQRAGNSLITGLELCL
jgi:phosphonate metabolism-associated iron-containing alcohol dehydrogenase